VKQKNGGLFEEDGEESGGLVTKRGGTSGIERKEIVEL